MQVLGLFYIENREITNNSGKNRDKFNKIVEEYDAVINKRNWISTWSKASFGDKILASACIHGLFFISLDLLCEWLKIKTKVALSHELVDIIGKMIIDQVNFLVIFYSIFFLNTK